MEQPLNENNIVVNDDNQSNNAISNLDTDLGVQNSNFNDFNNLSDLNRVLESNPDYLDMRLEFRDADKTAKDFGFDGGIKEAYYHYASGYERAQASRDPQAQAIFGQLESLWYKGRYTEALKLAKHSFGGPNGNTSKFSSERFGPSLNTNLSKDTEVYAFGSRAEYKQAQRSNNPVEKAKAEKAWRIWMETWKKDPDNAKTPFPPE